MGLAEIHFCPLLPRVVCLSDHHLPPQSHENEAILGMYFCLFVSLFHVYKGA